jgi:membrane protease YdiL (CAAX protease family)
MLGKHVWVDGLGRALRENKLAQIGELLAVFVIPFAVIMGTLPLVGENPLARHVVISVAILLMIAMIWLGLRLRGQNWRHFGLPFSRASRRTIVRSVLLSIVVLVAAVAAFAVGAVVMANVVGKPEGADMSSYDYLRGNLPMLILTLVSVYVTASFGEEVIYRGFLINRIAELGSGGKTSWRLAVVSSSIVFGLIHFHWGLAGMVQTGFMGLALGASYVLVRRNLWVTILAHGYMDTILILQLYFAAPGSASVK